MAKRTNPYPKKLKNKQGGQLEIRPLRPDEIEQEVAFYRSLDKKDQAKLPNDLGSPHYLKKMRHMIEDGIAHTLVAFEGNKIVGSLTLYRGRNNWVQHTGEVVIVTHPDHRRSGIATILINEIVPLADRLGIEKLYAHLMGEHKAAIRLFKQIGFAREATLGDHIKDSYGRYHNLRIYAMDLAAAHKAMDELMSHFHDYSG